MKVTIPSDLDYPSVVASKLPNGTLCRLSEKYSINNPNDFAYYRTDTLIVFDELVYSLDHPYDSWNKTIEVVPLPKGFKVILEQE